MLHKISTKSSDVFYIPLLLFSRTKLIDMKAGNIFTIGHSNRSIGQLIAILQSFGITMLADIRSVPASGFCPQFNKAILRQALKDAGIGYIHLPQLGGKRPGGFKPYMETKEFYVAVHALTQVALRQKLAYMCAEADWKQCHRSLISGFLFRAGWEVNHISGIAQSEPHMLLLRQGNLFAA
jgi:uncharacterized protein (DUF488 family)